MENIITLNKVNKSDSEIVGFKAIDLAELFNKKINISICFIIKTSLFDSFIEINNLKHQIKSLIEETNYNSEESLEETYQSIKELFEKHEFSEQDQNELMEAYETLAIDIEHIDIAKLVTTIEKPFLTIIGSPNYVDDSENNDSILQNVRGKNGLLKAIKHCWISLYTPKSLQYRKNNKIKVEEKMAIIIQRMMEVQISAQTYTDEEEIIVKTFIGQQDYHEEFEKDIAIFSKGNLEIKNTKVNAQEQKYVRDMRDNNLVKKALKEEGISQKLND
ncbi:MAG: PEP/pyruvate-binding domain-containing protein, partial [Nanoarchaeota archaeon]|nr:PEP/pyruvate-binding domain-containing protein [Nanoarchaeota archaeon]